MVFLKEFFTKGDLEKISRQQKNYPGGNEFNDNNHGNGPNVLMGTVLL